ncbi:MAG TPA: DinB family protein, partial [Vicinamibacterales bacterium]|nr:DinB family protein [Vicinamibacterales bacterium]
YGQLFGHTMAAQYAYCSTVKGEPSPALNKDLEKVTDKATVMQMVKDSFAYCDDAFAALTDANALQMITQGAAPNQRQIARANQLTMLIVHGNEHYGNLVTYMRMKGIVPPSSAQ